MEDFDFQIPSDMIVHTSRTKVRIENGNVVVESTWLGEDEPAMFMVLSPTAACDIARDMLDAAHNLRA